MSAPVLRSATPGSRLLVRLCVLASLTAALPSGAEPPPAPAGVAPVPAPAGIVTVRPTEAILSRQRLGQFVGISGANSGARGLSMNRAGDFLFIPPGVPHQPTNLSATEPAIAIVARNDPHEQEHVELLEPPAAP
jgi:hypothetical protein